MTNSAAWLGALLIATAAAAAPSTTVLLDEMTSTELAARIAAGTRIALLPVGGTEQNGPHMVLGKHNRRVLVLATRIAERLGNAVVAPVLAYVPEGTIDPPSQHMRWPGTISVAEPAFEAVLVGAARSLCRHGLREVVLLGDHGGYQPVLQRAAARAGRDDGCRVHALAEYYIVTQTDYVRDLKSHGVGDAEIGQHAGLADTSLALAVDPALVRSGVAAARVPGWAPTRSSTFRWPPSRRESSRQ
jgi:creatinine amidohydrolase